MYKYFVGQNVILNTIHILYPSIVDERRKEYQASTVQIVELLPNNPSLLIDSPRYKIKCGNSIFTCPEHLLQKKID